MSDHQSLLVTCEHGGFEVPVKYADWFRSSHAQRSLRSHRGYDPGAMVAAKKISDHFRSPLISSMTTRLLVDLNRSTDHHQLFSEFVPAGEARERQAILRKYYAPYRKRVHDWTAAATSRGHAVIHLSIHTFVPRIRGKWRPLDLGFLYDPRRAPESRWCQSWRRRLLARQPRLRARMNEPYAGVDDGLTTWLRTCFEPELYLGIELEINQRIFKRSPDRFQRLVSDLIATLPLDA